MDVLAVVVNCGCQYESLSRTLIEGVFVMTVEFNSCSVVVAAFSHEALSGVIVVAVALLYDAFGIKPKLNVHSTILLHTTKARFVLLTSF